MQWLAVYADGSGLPQYNADGTENKYTDIDRTRLKSFAVFDGEPPLIAAAVLVLHLHLEPGQRLIYRRRVALRSDGSEPFVVHMVGWQQTVDGRNTQTIACIFPDLHTEWIGRWREDHEWFYSPEFLEAEL